MGRSLLQKLLISALALGIIVLTAPAERSFTPKSKVGTSRPSKKLPKKDRIDLAMEQEVEMTKDPALGYVPTERLLVAKAYADQLRSTAKTTAALSGVEWVERGPSNVSGRTRAIMIDPNDPTGNSVFVASVAGGLWKTTDITATSPLWVPIDDFFGNLAVNSLAYDPSNPQIMYFGTGEGYFNSDAVRGNGIWKSTNGGTTWAQLPSTTGTTFYQNQRIVVTSTGIVLSATLNGLQRSTNGGTTWTKVLGTGMGITGATSNFIYDVDIAANGDIYASTDGSLHKSTDNGATWSAAIALPIAAGRIEIACAMSDVNYVYLLVENANVVSGILRSTDAGATWATRTEPDDADPGVPNTDFSRGQAWYDLCIAVDPNNRNRLFVGGIDLFVSNDGAGTWNQVSHWYGGFGEQYVHADQHFILFQNGSSSVCYFGNDGGIYRTTNATVAEPSIVFKGDNYNVTQFYACALHPAAYSSYFLAGAQDNGTQRFNNSGMNITDEATGGDGAFCHIDQDQPQFQFTQYVYNDYYRSNNSGATFTSVSGGTTGRFINPSDYDNVNNRMYAARNNDQYLRWDNPQTGATFTTIAITAFGGGQVSAVKVSPNTANRVFFGCGNGAIVRVDNAHQATPTATVLDVAGMPNNYVSSIEVEVGNDNHILATFSNYGVVSVWETTNGGTSWTAVEGNLPDMPIRWILLNPNNNTQAIVATQLGVWSTDLLNGASTVWGPSNSGLANVRTDMLRLRTSDKLVIAATHGRGLYSSDIFADPVALFDSDKHVVYTGKPVNFINGSYRSTSWSWNFGDGSPLSNLEDPAHIYAAPGRYSVTLTINGGASTLTKTDFILVLPDRGTPYAPSDGGNFDVNMDDFGPENWTGTPWQRGNSAIAGKNGVRSAPNAWVTGLTAANYSDQNHVVLFAPSYNMTAAGTYTLNFYSKFNTEPNYDGFRVEYSLNKGDTWTILGTTGTGWYNFANTTENTAFPINQPYFAGNVSTAYALYSRDISFLSGNPSVAFRFVFRSDFSVTAPGVALDDFSITGPANPAAGLPVEGSPLVGVWEANGAMLTWDSYREIGNRGFMVQRSSDGLNFKDLAFVPGKGYSNEPSAYSYLDKDAKGGNWYYRYEQMDQNGGTSLSNVVLLTSSANAVPVFQAYPSPFQDELSFVLSGVPQGDISIRLLDLNGKVVFQSDVNHTPGLVKRLSGLSALAGGTYVVQVRYEGGSLSKRIIHE